MTRAQIGARCREEIDAWHQAEHADAPVTMADLDRLQLALDAALEECWEFLDTQFHPEGAA